MRARLRLDHEGITVLLAASVEEYLRASGAVYSWQGPIREYDQHRGLLILDDGRRLNVVVDGSFLRQFDSDG
jgi:hypothetical protein